MKYEIGWILYLLAESKDETDHIITIHPKTRK